MSLNINLAFCCFMLNWLAFMRFQSIQVFTQKQSLVTGCSFLAVTAGTSCPALLRKSFSAFIPQRLNQQQSQRCGFLAVYALATLTLMNQKEVNRAAMLLFHTRKQKSRGENFIYSEHQCLLLSVKKVSSQNMNLLKVF